MTILQKDKGQLRRKRLLQMNINALIGYIFVEVFAVIASSIGISGISYTEIALLAAIVNTGTIGFIIALFLMPSVPKWTEPVFFLIELLLFLILFSCAVFYLRELRMAGLIFALVAVSVELPFTTVKESLAISVGALVAFTITSYYAIEVANQKGILSQELLFAACFTVPLIFISYVSQQISGQKKEMLRDREALRMLNNELKAKNTALLKSQIQDTYELELASHVQAAFFLQKPPETDGWDISFLLRPAHGVSGDFFDIYTRGTTLTGIAVFDVSGHGISSGLITMIAKPIMFRLFTSLQESTLGEIARQAREIISNEISNIDNYITGVLLRFTGGTVQYVNAGHPNILLKKGRSGIVKEAAPNAEFRGLPIGMDFTSAPFNTIQFDMEPGDILLIFTDGIIDGFNSEKKSYGMKRLLDAFSSAPTDTARDITSHIINDFYTFTGQSFINDDVTLMAVKKAD